MFSFAILLLVASFNIYLALMILRALLTGATRVSGQAISRMENPRLFWIAVASRATAAVVFGCFVVSVMTT